MSLVLIIVIVLWTYRCTGKILGIRFYPHLFAFGSSNWFERAKRGSRVLTCYIAYELDEWLMSNGRVLAVQAKHGISKSSHCILDTKGLMGIIIF